MSKGLKVTLMVVAIALIGYRAMATAPVIGDIKDVIIGNENSATDPNSFVYGDAIDLSSAATDDGGAAGIVWSYAESTGMYTVNGKASIALGTDDPTAPGAKAIAGAGGSVATGEVNADSNANTVTFRNQAATPLGGGAATKTYTANGVQDGKVLTLFAGDGSTYSMTTIMVYTDKGGNDRLSPTNLGPVPTPVANLNFVGSTPAGWAFGVEFGSVTSSTANGACSEVPAAGVNSGIWYSAYGAVQLTDNSVYRMRATMNSNQNTKGLNPLWDFLIDNFDVAGVGQSAFGGDYLFLDNEGGANAPNASTGGRSSFEIWFAPLSIQTPQWRDAASGAFTAANEPKNDMRLQFRIFDIAGAGYGGETDLGRLCMSNLQVDKFNIADLTEAAEVYNCPSMSISGPAEANPQKWTVVGAVPGATVPSAAGGVLTIAPATADSWTAVEYAAITPGDSTVNIGAGTGLADNWMIPWESNTLYKVEVSVSANLQIGVDNPVDSLRIGMDVPTTEMLAVSNITPQLGRAGSPKLTPATYTFFLYSHSQSLTTIPNAKVIRPRIDFLCAQGLQANGLVQNAGGFKIHSVRVAKIVPAVQ